MIEQSIPIPHDTVESTPSSGVTTARRFVRPSSEYEVSRKDWKVGTFNERSFGDFVEKTISRGRGEDEYTVMLAYPQGPHDLQDSIVAASILRHPESGLDQNSIAGPVERTLATATVSIPDAKQYQMHYRVFHPPKSDRPDSLYPVPLGSTPGSEAGTWTDASAAVSTALADLSYQHGDEATIMPTISRWWRDDTFRRDPHDVPVCKLLAAKVTGAHPFLPTAFKKHLPVTKVQVCDASTLSSAPS